MNTRIRFKTKHDREIGYHLILHGGTMVYCDDTGGYFVSEEGLKKLDGAKIGYEIEEAQGYHER